MGGGSTLGTRAGLCVTAHAHATFHTHRPATQGTLHATLLRHPLCTGPPPSPAPQLLASWERGPCWPGPCRPAGEAPSRQVPALEEAAQQAEENGGTCTV